MVDGLLLAGCVLTGGAAGAFAHHRWQRHQLRHRRFPLPEIRPGDFDERLRLDTVESAQRGMVKYVSNDFQANPSAPSDLESYILARLATGARRMFEFGTCSGRTTYLWALNSPGDAVITTVTLSPKDPTMALTDQMTRGDINHVLGESGFHDFFVYSGTEVAYKVRQLFQDTATLDTTPFRRQMDLIFVDGGHSYPYVRNDSMKALEMVAPGGVILWHDYRGRSVRAVAGVYRYLNELSRTHSLRLLRGTALVAYREPVV